MATTLQPVPVSLLLPTGKEAQNQRTTYPKPGAVWRRGDFLAFATTGTITNPNPNGTGFINFLPTSIPTTGTTASASATAQLVYYFYTYTDGTHETQPSATYPLYVPAGDEGTVTVAADGNYPSGATDFILYAGPLPGGNGPWQQVASTALGSAATVPYTLTNNQGAQRAATNASSSIIGYAVNDWDVTFANFQYTGGQAGFTQRALFGQDQSGPIGVGYEQYQAYYINLTSVAFVISLVQPYYSSVFQATAGLFYNSTYQCFQADTSQSNKILTIVGKFGISNPNNSFDPVGGEGDTNALVIAQFNAGLLAGS
jgi:hypothetical protein